MDREESDFAGVRGDLFSVPDARCALNLLRAGNARFVSDEIYHPPGAQETRQLLADKGQQPFACILGCADSRVPPERIFDVGPGQLFVVRVAGNVADDMAIGSVEYAAEHLGVPLVVVLGHSGCGMIAAAMAGSHASPYINSIIAHIEPSIDKLKNDPDALTACRCEDENILNTISGLSGSQALNSLVTQGKLRIIGAKYELSTGVVDFRE